MPMDGERELVDHHPVAAVVVIPAEEDETEVNRPLMVLRPRGLGW